MADIPIDPDGLTVLGDDDTKTDDMTLPDKWSLVTPYGTTSHISLKDS